MQTKDQNQLHKKVEVRLRSIRTLWMGLVLSIGIYFAFTLFLARRPENVQPHNTLSLAFIVIAASAALASFLIKQKLLAQAYEQRQDGMVQQAYVTALAMTEVGALLGVIDFFVTSNPYYYIPFLIAAFADLLHFPRREHVVNAMFGPSDF